MKSSEICASKTWIPTTIGPRRRLVAALAFALAAQGACSDDQSVVGPVQGDGSVGADQVAADVAVKDAVVDIMGLDTTQAGDTQPTGPGSLCDPCTKSSDCDPDGTSACVSHGAAGSYCGRTCSADGDCPSGYACTTLSDLVGGSGKYCAPPAGADGQPGACTCSAAAIAKGASTTCTAPAGDGPTCPGTRKCEAAGLSACEAVEAADEVCDGVDNDCDDATDEDTCDDSNPCTADSCAGAQGCKSEPTTADCDADGSACTVDGCTDGTCVVGEAKDCQDANPCTDDVCDPKTGDCGHSPVAAGGPCDDDSKCTQDDVCTEGSCSGKVLACDDANPCTDDLCDAKIGCTTSANSAPCDDNDACSVGESCANELCAGGQAKDCNDDNVCTKDACDPATGACTNVALETECDDGNKCTSEDACVQGLCVGKAKDCDDGNPCTTNLCNADGGCGFNLNTNPCDDGDLCTDFDACGEGKCAGTGKEAADCDDGNPCTTDGCDAKTGCTHSQNSAACDDGSPCTVGDSCEAGKCVGGTNTCDCTTNDACTKNNPANACLGTLYCDKSKAPFKCTINPATVVKCDSSLDNFCAASSCDPKTGTCAMESKQQGNPCDADGSLCTSGDKCDQGKCLAGAVLKCDDANPCTTDSCDPAKGCQFIANGDGCNADDNACTVGDACKDKVCIAGGKKACDDDNPCTADSCDAATGKCAFAGAANDGDLCDADGSVCTIGDACKDGACVKGKAQQCDDGNPCTDDACDKVKGCDNAANSAPCDADGDACSENDACKDKVCLAGKPKACDDNESCTKDACDAKTGNCTHDGSGSEGLACNADDSACTVSDSCKGGVCTSGNKLDCDDNIACTADVCDAKSGCMHNSIGGLCDDGDPCTGGDACAAGKCVGTLKDCDDNNSCTKDSCDGAKGCVNVATADKCDDGVECTVGDACAAGKCVAGTNICACAQDVDCKAKEDGNPCTGTLYCNKAKVPYQCDPNPKTVITCDTSKDTTCMATVCDPADAKCKAQVLNEGKVCDADGSLCTLGDKCEGGLCKAGPKLDCDDKNACTNDICDPKKGCTLTNNAQPCDKDNDLCTVNDTCANGACVAGSAKSCDDGDKCTNDKCDPASGKCTSTIIIGCGGNCTDDKHCNDNDTCTDETCVGGKCNFTFKTGPCDDGSLCTKDDACVKGKCTGTPLDCNDNNPCTNDGCSPNSGCVNNNNTAPCDDFDGCTAGDICTDGKCVAGKPKVCDDSDKCTTDACNPATGQCIFKGIPGCGGYCDTAVDCDDKNVCTDEACDKGKCVSGANTKACDDADLCTTGDVCASGKCAGKAKTCDDANPCTADSCDSKNGNCVNAPSKEGAACDDGSVCTTSDACATVAGKLVCTGKAKSCDDANVCTNDACDAKAGLCTHSDNSGPCEDGDSCTAGDTCATGKCVTGKGVWVDTLAGDGGDGFADGDGVKTKFSYPYGVLADTAGNVYVADSNNHVIRQVAKDGKVTTLAGAAGKAGLLDGTGDKAWFNRPFGLAWHPSGDIIVADRDSHAIRRLTLKGVVTTVAGDGTQGATDGAAASARFYHPWDVAVTAGGVIYVADRTNNRIRKIAGDVVSTLAGSSYGFADGKGSVARFRYPQGVAVDGEGRLYVADERNHRIRAISAAGDVTTLAGGAAGYLDGAAATARFNRPWGVRVGPDGALFIGDRYNHRIRSLSAGTVATLAGGAAGHVDGAAAGSRFQYPAGVAVDPSGYVYVADGNNHRVRRVRDTTAPCSIGGVCYTAGAGDPADPCQACLPAASTSKWSAKSDGAACSDNDPCTTKDACKTGNCGGAPVSCDDGDKCTLDGCDSKTGGCANKPIVGCGGNCSSDADCADKNDCSWGARCVIGKCTAGGLTQVSTVAGNGVEGYKDGLGKAAFLNRPFGLDDDGAGNLYVADRHNHRVRRVAANGATTTYAGNGFAGWADGAKANAQFNYPSDVAVAADGAMHLADTNNHRIRTISKSGVVSTLAGGTPGFADGKGAGARMAYPYSVAVNGAGIVYVADYNNNRVRKVEADGTVSTLAGSTLGFADGLGAAARFNHPIGVAVDAAGNVLVADYSNHRIRKVSPEGQVTTLAGSGVAGYQDGVAAAARFYHPWGIDVDSAGNVFVADHVNRRVRKLSPKGIVTLFAGIGNGYVDGDTGVARFGPPVGLAVDPQGYIYVGDYSNHAIRRVRDTSATCFIGGVCWTGEVADPANSCQSCDAAKSGTAWSGKADGAECTDGILCSRPDKCTGGKCAGATVVCDDKNKCTKDFCDTNSGGCAYQPIVGCDDYCEGPQHCDDKNVCTSDSCTNNKCSHATNAAPCDDGSACTMGDTCSGGSCKAGDKVWVDTLAGSTAGWMDALGTAAKFSYPNGVAADAAGNVYVADRGNNRVRKVGPDGSTTTVAGSGQATFADGKGQLAAFNAPSDVAVDGAGKVYVADRSNQRIRVIAKDGTVTTLAGQAAAGWVDGKGASARFYNPFGITVTAGGVVYVADYSNRRIRRVLPDGTVTTLAGSTAGQSDGTGSLATFSGPIDVAVAPSGDLAVVDYTGHRVRLVSAEGAVTTLAGSTLGFQDGKGSAVKFNYPRGLTWGPDGAVYVADQSNHRVRRVAMDGTTTTYAGSGAGGNVDGDAVVARMSSPRGVTFDSEGTLYVGDRSNQRIRRVRATKTPCLIGGACLANGVANPANPCQVCDGVKDAKAWTGVAEDGGCVDGVACTDKDACKGGKCAGVANGCDDGDKCTTDSCDAVTGACVNTKIVGCAGFCLQDSHCDDKNPCTDDKCAAGKCASTNNSAACDDGSECTQGDSCKDGKCLAGGAVWVDTVAGTSGGFEDGSGVDVKFNNPAGIAVSGGGVAFVGDYNNNRIRRIAADGTTTTLAGSGDAGLKNGKGTGAWFNRPAGVVVDSADTVSVADRYSHAIRQVLKDGTTTTLAGNGAAAWADGKGAAARFNQPIGLARSASGLLYVADWANHRVRVISSDGTVSTLAGGTAGYLDGIGSQARFNGPIGVAVDGAGSVYVVDYSNHRLRRITAEGVVTTLAGSGAQGALDGDPLTAQFRYPWGVALDSAGRIYIADTGNHRLRLLHGGVVTTFAGGASGSTDGVGSVARFYSPTGITADSNGAVWVADYNNNRVRLARATASGCAIGGACQAKGASNPANPCQTCDGSKSTAAWTATGDTGACDDGAACTSSDACTGGKCAGKAKGCDDSDKCTTDACDAKSGACTHVAIAGCS